MAAWPWNCLFAVLWMAVDDFHGFRSCMVRPWHPGCPWRLVWENSVESSSRSSKSGMHSGIWSRHPDLSGGGMPDLPAYVGEVPVVIVLGAQVKGTRPSRALERRLKKAEAFLKEHPDTLAVLSGGQGDGEDITEAQCMYDWLTEHGIASRRLILEERSTSTEENLKFSAAFLDKTAPVGILTSNFHVYRALRLAKKQGYAKPCGIPAKSDARYQVHYLVREFFALVKEKIKGNI